ncbi:tRNA(fMet)-specific endonuclease VapC [Klebsiella aerogenes]|nr:tRNA(fMet)-specific endonuclease VapC [Klebsiella aerogenes]
MLDTNICSFIMREQPEAVLKRLDSGAAWPPYRGLGHHLLRDALRRHRPEGLPAISSWLTRSVARLDAILPWDRAAVDATTEIKVALRQAGTPIGPNDTAIAGHAIAGRRRSGDE